MDILDEIDALRTRVKRSKEAIYRRNRDAFSEDAAVLLKLQGKLDELWRLVYNGKLDRQDAARELDFFRSEYAATTTK